jgi:hypothetical protein
MTSGEVQPGVPIELVTSSFNNIPFSWAPGGPHYEKQADGLQHFTGTAVLYRNSDVDSFIMLYKPVTITTVGEGMNVYIDYWGSDPSRPLTVLGTSVAQNAILVSFKRDEDWFRNQQFRDQQGNLISTQIVGVARCTVDFIVTDNVAGAAGGGGSNMSSSGGGIQGGGGGTVVGTQSFVPAASDTGNAQALDLWLGDPPENIPPDDNWFDLSYDSSWWQAAGLGPTGGGDYFSGSQPIWTWDGVADGQQVLFRHEFALPAGTITHAELDLLVGGCDISVWVNGSQVMDSNSPGSPGWPVDVSGNLTVGDANLIAIMATSSSADTAYVSYKLVMVMSGS